MTRPAGGPVSSPRLPVLQVIPSSPHRLLEAARRIGMYTKMTIGSGGRVVRIALFTIGAVGVVLIGVLYWPWPYTALAVILVLLIAIIVPLERRVPGKKL